jgi:hypothetical protein
LLHALASLRKPFIVGPFPLSNAYG